jgi:hypothetical protein
MIEETNPLRHPGVLLGHREASPVKGAPMGAAILWVDNAATRIYWINDQGLSGEGAQSISHWLNGEITLHRESNTTPYLARIVAMLERIERALLIGRRSEGERAGPQQAADGDGGNGGATPIREWELRRVPDQHEGGRRSLLVPAGTGGLERLTRLLERERPDLHRRVVAILALETEHLDDALLFALARRYLHPQLGMGRR